MNDEKLIAEIKTAIRKATEWQEFRMLDCEADAAARAAVVRRNDGFPLAVRDGRKWFMGDHPIDNDGKVYFCVEVFGSDEAIPLAEFMFSAPPATDTERA